eukprot:scaffold57902_cov51-Phaeocystis_antarctica.AAC.1
MVHVRARPVDLGNLVCDAPNRLDVTDLFMQRCGRRQRSWTNGSDCTARALRCDWQAELRGGQRALQARP